VPYSYLGGGAQLAAATDTTGFNTGNLTTVIDMVTCGFGRTPAEAEIYHMVVDQVLPGASAKIMWNTSKLHGFTQPFTGSEWWGIIPMRPSDQLTFLWSLASTVTPVPLLTAWWRYDPSLPSNFTYSAGGA
jgi:hypothetical protein